MHHIGNVLPVKSRLLLIKLSNLLIASSSSNYSTIKYWIVTAPIMFHGLSETSETFSNIAKLSIVMVLTLGCLVSCHLGHVLNSCVEQATKLTEYLNFSVNKIIIKGFFRNLNSCIQSTTHQWI